MQKFIYCGAGLGIAKRLSGSLVETSFCWILLLAGLCGCDRSEQLMRNRTLDETAATDLATSRLSPKAIVAESVSAYRRLNSYEDDAYVSLHYKLDGEPYSDRAPLSIAWEKGGPLGLRVYSVQAGPSQDRWRLRIAREDLAATNQILSRAIPEEIDFDWLLNEPAVAQGLAAGLGGFPPQLDLLLSPQPMQGLVNESAMLSFGEQTKIDGRSCHVINVIQAQRTYQLSIDRSTMLLRRLRLPSADFPREMVTGKRVSDVDLTIEFANARSNEPISWARYEVDRNSGDHLVNQFVPEPPSLDTADLGIRVPAFSLRSPRGNLVFESSRANRGGKATVMMWLADHPSCRVAAQQLSEAVRVIQSDPELAGAVEFVSIWAEPAPPKGETFDSLPGSWQLPGTLAIDREAMGRDLFKIVEAPSLVILDSQNAIQLRESSANPLLGQLLPQLLARLLAGENLASRLLSEADSAQKRFQNSLRMARAIDGLASRTEVESDSLESYEPLLVSLKRLQTTQHGGRVVAAVADSEHRIWRFQESGTLERSGLRAGGLESIATYETDWEAKEGSRLLVGPFNRYVALCAPEVNLLHVYDTTQQQDRSIEIHEPSRLLDFAWLTLNGSKSPRLAAITDADRLILLDPRNREQLSGKCPSSPLAIVHSSFGDGSVEGLVVLSDRSVEPLQLSQESSHMQSPLLGHPAAFGKTEESENPESQIPSKRLGFQPAQGPWHAWRDGAADSLVLARGWIAKDEPGLFLLNAEFQPLWHYRTALQPRGTVHPTRISCAKDPDSGQPTWAMSDADQTIHLLRADGLTDHLRMDQELVGIALLPSGSELLLVIVYPQETALYQLKWR